MKGLDKTEKRILNRLRRGQTVTAGQARVWWGADRLASRIHTLRALGVKVRTELVKIKKGKWVGKYSLKQKHKPYHEPI